MVKNAMPCEVGNFEISMEGGVCVVRAPEDLASIEWDWIEPISEEVFSEFASVDSPRVVVDLEGAESISAAFLSLLLRIWNRVESLKGQMGLCGVSDSAQKLLLIAALDSTWRRYSNRVAALQALGDK